VKGILIIDHGSMKEEANRMLECVGELVQRMAGESVVVRVAHMELAAPTIADGFEACIAAGATEIVAFPYMLSPGKHSTRDIPRMVAEISAAHSGVPVRACHLWRASRHIDACAQRARHRATAGMGAPKRVRRALAWPRASRASRRCARRAPNVRLSP
jgi:sirohydrochlorin ferrochelatase